MHSRPVKAELKQEEERGVSVPALRLAFHVRLEHYVDARVQRRSCKPGAVLAISAALARSFPVSTFYGRVVGSRAETAVGVAPLVVAAERVAVAEATSRTISVCDLPAELH